MQLNQIGEYQSVVLPLSYLAPIGWYSVYKRSKQVSIEAYDTLPRQSIHSRCRIDGPNGTVLLSVPVQDKGKIITRDARIQYRENWADQHIRSIKTSYKSSPFFEYIEDDLCQIISSHPVFLLDLNIQIHNLLSAYLRIGKKDQYTEEWRSEYPETTLDLRKWEKNGSLSIYDAQPYNQVFAGKNNFIPQLSALDLLVNEGPLSGEWL